MSDIAVISRSYTYIYIYVYCFFTFLLFFVVESLSCVQLCEPMNCSMPGFSVHHYLPVSGSFPMNQFFGSGDHSIGASASLSILPMNKQGWFPLGLTGLISLLAKGLSTVFSNTIVQKHQFFGTQPSLCYNSHISMWLLEKS